MKGKVRMMALQTTNTEATKLPQSGETHQTNRTLIILLAVIAFSLLALTLKFVLAPASQKVIEKGAEMSAAQNQANEVADAKKALLNSNYLRRDFDRLKSVGSTYTIKEVPAPANASEWYHHVSYDNATHDGTPIIYLKMVANTPMDLFDPNSKNLHDIETYYIVMAKYGKEWKVIDSHYSHKLESSN